MRESIMSSPIYRSTDPNEVSFYAPKWQRNGKAISDVRGAGDFEIANSNVGIANNGVENIHNFETNKDRRQKPPEPTVVPGPPTAELWAERWVRRPVRTSNGIGAITGVLLLVFLAALVALGFAVVWPTIQDFNAAPKSIAAQASKRGDDEPKPAAAAPPGASETIPASERSLPVEQQNPSLDFASRVPGVFNAPAGLEQFAVVDGRLSWPTPGPVRSAPVNQAPAAPPVAEAKPSVPPVSTPIVKATPTPKAPVRSLGRDEIETLLKQGHDFVSVGDFSSARIVFGRVAEAGDARGALAVAATYDPVALAKISARGGTPDTAKAREWYQKAKDLGSAEAGPRLEALSNAAR
jgi:hypothetical protein